jgi:hypothetical protein
MLSTYSSQRSLDNSYRKRLFRGISDLIESGCGGRIVKGYLTTLYVARRL